MKRTIISYLVVVLVCVLVVLILVKPDEITIGVRQFFYGSNSRPRMFYFQCGIFTSEIVNEEQSFTFAKTVMRDEDPIGLVLLRRTEDVPHDLYLVVQVEGETVTDVEKLSVWRKRMLDFAEQLQIGGDSSLSKFGSELEFAASAPSKSEVERE